MDRSPLSRQLLTGGSAAAQLFLTALGKRNSLRQNVYVHTWEKQAGCLAQSSLEYWFCPRFQTSLSTGRAVGGSSHQLVSNEGHLSRATSSPMAPGAGGSYVWPQPVPTQENQKGVWASSIHMLKKARQHALNWLTLPTDFPRIWPLFIQLFLTVWRRGLQR